MRKSTKTPRILKIHQIDGFRITCVFNSGEYKTIDFSKILANVSESDPEYPLKDLATFNQVIVNDSQTLAWPNVLLEMESFDSPGTMEKYPLDLDPMVLYSEGEPFVQATFDIGGKFKEARKSLGLTLDEVAKRAGTTKAYLSRFEHGKSDIELGTLRKIINLGLGGALNISFNLKIASAANIHYGCYHKGSNDLAQNPGRTNP